MFWRGLKQGGLSQHSTAWGPSSQRAQFFNFRFYHKWKRHSRDSLKSDSCCCDEAWRWRTDWWNQETLVQIHSSSSSSIPSNGTDGQDLGSQREWSLLELPEGHYSIKVKQSGTWSRSLAVDWWHHARTALLIFHQSPSGQGKNFGEDAKRRGSFS